MTMNLFDDKKGPNVKFPPPLFFLSAIFLAYQVHKMYPIHIVESNAIRSISISLMLICVLLLAYIFGQFIKAATSIEPWKPTNSIITTGLYAHSRNPIYLIFCIFTIAIGLYMNSLWVVLSFLPAVLLLNQTVIKKEEAYLERKFGVDYIQYKMRVRRWI